MDDGDFASSTNPPNNAESNETIYLKVTLPTTYNKSVPTDIGIKAATSTNVRNNAAALSSNEKFSYMNQFNWAITMAKPTTNATPANVVNIYASDYTDDMLEVIFSNTNADIENEGLTGLLQTDNLLLSGNNLVAPVSYTGIMM